MRYRLDRRVQLRDGGRTLLGGDPTKLLRLSESGAGAVRRWFADGIERDGATPATVALIDRLIDQGMLHPAPAATEGAGPTVIVPVRDRVEDLERCLRALVASAVTDVVVVDDGSLDPNAHRAVAERHGAVVVSRARSGGPASARMAGWSEVVSRAVTPEFVAFVDSDIEVTPECWGALSGHFATPATALVAPRVRHTAGVGLVDRYEAANSPLDLGADPAPVRAGTRVAYVPAAVLLVRTAAFVEVGGFDASLEVGEDVDLLWRLVDAGWGCRYEPRSEVVHRGRSSVGAMLRRRFDYGRSAAALDARHRGALPPVRGSRWSAAVVGAAAAGHPFVAAGIAGWTVAAMARRLDAVPGGRRLAARLVLAGHVGFGRQVARALVRPWFPISVAVSLISRRARRIAVVAALVAPLLAWRERRPAVALAPWVALWLADDAAYAAGVWVGCVRHRNGGALLPDVRGANTQN